VRIGAALGVALTALGIVSGGCRSPTPARQARRLLQRVQEFAPDDIELRTTVRIGAAAEGILEAATGGGRPHLFGWGGPPPPPGRKGAQVRAVDAVFSPTIDEVVREAPCDIAVVKQRGVADVRRILVPVRGGPHAELALRFADALGRGLAPVEPSMSCHPASTRSCSRRLSGRWRPSSDSTPTVAPTR
jgi:hypothetical protein